MSRITAPPAGDCGKSPTGRHEFALGRFECIFCHAAAEEGMALHVDRLRPLMGPGPDQRLMCDP